jgi:hypothetical protein
MQKLQLTPQSLRLQYHTKLLGIQYRTGQSGLCGTGASSCATSRSQRSPLRRSPVRCCLSARFSSPKSASGKPPAPHPRDGRDCLSCSRKTDFLSISQQAQQRRSAALLRPRLGVPRTVGYELATIILIGQAPQIGRRDANLAIPKSIIGL